MTHGLQSGLRLAGAGLAAVLLTTVVGACGEESPPGGGGGSDTAAIQPLAKADGWRDGLAESSFNLFGLVEVAYDRGTAELAWQENVPDGLPEQDGRPTEPGRYGNLESVDFGTHAVVVWSSGQSGSCPGWLADIRTNPDGAVELETDQDGSTCTDDYNAYRMVYAVALDRLPEPEQLPVSTVIVDGRSGGASSLIDAYPTGA